MLEEGVIGADQAVPVVGGDGGDAIYDLGDDAAKISRLAGARMIS
ncbi:MAG TPA: hypothetical protein VGP07_09990 [Polyangia bacterium]|jgi:hypothetical protein